MNNLSSINLTANTALATLILELNQIASIDLSQNTNLLQVRVNDNLLTTLSIAQSPQLTQINCANNLLTSLDLRNGNNVNFILLDNGALNNPDLDCINVDNPIFSTANWGIAFHETATYSANCLLSTSTNQLQTFAVYPNPSNGKVFISSPESIKIDQITILDINGRIIKSITPHNIQEQYELDLSGINQGVYFAAIDSSEGKLTRKIILQ
jgi:hypothetical protein